MSVNPHILEIAGDVEEIKIERLTEDSHCVYLIFLLCGVVYNAYRDFSFNRK